MLKRNSESTNKPANNLKTIQTELSEDKEYDKYLTRKVALNLANDSPKKQSTTYETDEDKPIDTLYISGYKLNVIRPKLDPSILIDKIPKLQEYKMSLPEIPISQPVKFIPKTPKNTNPEESLHKGSRL